MTRITPDWLAAAETQQVLALLADAGYAAYPVGGCVRNALMGLPTDDIDIATDALPEVVLARAKAAGLRTVPTGIEHGTVTVLHGQPFEVTTFRADVSTDGRRATVAFSTDIETDAARRDFTMNALYARADGTVLDPNGAGVKDVAARRIRFIGTPAARIAEDGLRILRFFRFAAIYGATDAPLDAEGLVAIKAAQDALTPVSKERIGTEMRKLLSAPSPGGAVSAMADTGVLHAVHPGADVHRLLAVLRVEGRANLPRRWLRRLGALAGTGWTSALRLSRNDARHIDEVEAARHMALRPHALSERFGPHVAEDVLALNWALNGQEPAANWRADVELGAAAVFPLKGRNLAGRYAPGPQMGAALERLHAAWVDSHFTLDQAALLAIDSDRSI